jgi:CRP-like cAMP-binding protein
VDQGNVLKATAAAQLIIRIDPENDEILDRLKDLFLMDQAVSDSQLQEYQESIKHLEELQSTQQEPATSLQEESEEEHVSAETAEEVIYSLKQIPLFAKLSVSELRGIYTYSLLHHLTAGEPIITGGNQRRSLFAILEGSVKVLGKDKDGRDIFLVTLNAGTSFGEFALFGRIDTNVSVIAEEPCRILEIPREIVLKLAKTRSAMIDDLKTLFRHRILQNALARVPLFSQLTPQNRQKIVKHFKPVRAKHGTILMREGEPGDSMYFIAAGEVGVYTSLTEADDGSTPDTDSDQLLLATLKIGDFFGEQALVTNNPRSATVIALTDVALLQFSKPDLEAVIKEHPWIESEIQVEAFEHLMRKNISILNQLVSS